MLYEVNWAEDGTYRPGEENSPEKFFNDCLENSKEFDLQLGYFSSAAISVLADGFASFISKGGKMRLVINQIVSEEDKQAITKGVKGGIIECFDLSNFDELRKTFDEYQQQFFDCLAFLIYDNRIDIRIIRPRNSSGIAHTKSGQFRDGDSITSFTGSANFTINGLFNNLEEIKIDRSDSIDPMTRKRIENQRIDFDRIMAQEKANIKYLSPDELIAAVKSNFGDKTIEELLDVEQKLRTIKREKAIKKADGKQQETSVIKTNQESPQFPYPSGPRDYQCEAFENWKKNGQKGLFAMATGTGKTITSLNCLLEIYNRKKYYKALILVPTITLVNQWEKECLKFNFTNIIKVCSANPSWKNDLASIRMLERLRGDKVSYVLISTYASFVKDRTFDALNSFSPSQLLLIADEAHNLGATSLRKKMNKVVYGRRIGLSATPDRQYDEVGNDAINEFFNIKEGYTFEYSMKEAIENGVLCKYLYYPHLIELTDTEMDEYIAISQKIVKYFNFNKGVFDKSDEILTGLLIKRKRIIHKAINKQNVFRDILQKRIDETGTLKYTLVYVPEGNKPDTYEADKYILSDVADNGDDETQHLIDMYTSIVRDISPKTTVRKFTSDSAERDEILLDFAKGNVEVLTSMKCLDEGVDVPRSELAIFCASTGNPRQFIQRRGRVLRTHPDKKLAVLHDLVVAPKVAASDSTYQMERSMLKSELLRVNNFATLSLNPFYAQQELDDIMNYYNLNLFNN